MLPAGNFPQSLHYAPQAKFGPERLVWALIRPVPQVRIWGCLPCRGSLSRPDKDSGQVRGLESKDGRCQEANCYLLDAWAVTTDPRVDSSWVVPAQWLCWLSSC